MSFVKIQDLIGFVSEYILISTAFLEPNFFKQYSCFSLYLPFVFFVFLTILMTIWLQKCSDLATQYRTIKYNVKRLAFTQYKQAEFTNVLIYINLLRIKTTFTLLRSKIMLVEFTCVYTTPLYFLNLFKSTNVNQNQSKEIETKSIQIYCFEI